MNFKIFYVVVLVRIDAAQRNFIVFVINTYLPETNMRIYFQVLLDIYNYFILSFILTENHLSHFAYNKTKALANCQNTVDSVLYSFAILLVYNII